MRGEVKQLLEFFKLLGKVDYQDNISDEVEAYYYIELEPDYSQIPLFDLNRLQELVEPNKVKIWFYYDHSDKENKCHIEIEVPRQK